MASDGDPGIRSDWAPWPLRLVRMDVGTEAYLDAQDRA